MRVNRYVILFIYLISMNSFGQQSETITHQCVDTSGASKRFEFLKLMGGEPDYQSDSSLYVGSISKNDVLIDVRGESKKNIVDIKSSLKIPLNFIKTKSYLKNNSLVVIDNGFNLIGLEKEVKRLQLLGFESIKILDGGVLSLDDMSFFKDDIPSQFLLRLKSAENLLKMSLENNSNVIFVNLNVKTSMLDNVNLLSLHLPYSNERVFMLNMKNEISRVVNKNTKLHVVFIHEKTSVYREIFSFNKFQKHQHVWFMDGGNSALSVIKNNVASIDKARKRVNVSCL